MKILGAGMAGLLAANILRRNRPIIYEKQGDLPDNHSAVLRFRTDSVSRATGIPFRKVIVNKAIMKSTGELTSQPSIDLSNMYSRKVTGRIIDRSIINMTSEERYIAPPDFIKQMASSCEIMFNFNASKLIDSEFLYSEITDETKIEPIISTIPMPVLMNLLNLDPNKIGFDFNPIWILSADIVDPEIDVYQTIYFPDPDTMQYRASITGKRIIVEYLGNPGILGKQAMINTALRSFGLRNVHLGEIAIKHQPFGKIVPTNNLLRKNFIHSASEKFHIYSLGRFATWRQVLLDDLVRDVQFIEEFIAQRDLYSATKSLISINE